ncbi:hypothetical protein TWF281_011525 [Arthrobotrys megalospora]
MTLPTKSELKQKYKPLVKRLPSFTKPPSAPKPKETPKTTNNKTNSITTSHSKLDEDKSSAITDLDMEAYIDRAINDIRNRIELLYEERKRILEGMRPK